MKRVFGAVLAGSLLALAVTGCGSRGPEGEVVARVGSRQITLQELESRLEEIPSFARSEFKGPEGRQRLLDRLIQEEMMYQAALDEGLPKDEEVAKQLEIGRRRTLVDFYYRRFIEGAAKLSDAEVEEYYLAHPDEFTEPEQMRVRHILVDSEREAKKILRSLDGTVANFEEVAREKSQDERTRAQGGLIPGYVAKDRPVGSMGKLPELVDAALSLEAGKLSGVVKTSKGYHILLVEEKKPERLRPLEEVRDQIESRGSGERVRAKFDEVMETLRERYHVEVIEKGLEEASIPTARELFQLAQEARDPEERLRYYEQILEHYPDNDRCYEAQFMIGFIYSEDMKEYEKAATAFNAVLEKYPDSDLVESAQWMIDNMGKEAPVFEEPEETGESAG